MKIANYNKTKLACYLGYISQAIVVSYAPLLFVHFNRSYAVSLGEIAVIPVLFFAVQLLVDMICSVFAEKINYRKCIIVAEACTSIGLIGLAFIPRMLSVPFFGVLLCTFIYAVGSGLTEVLCNPIIEACPFENKESVITSLSAVYSFGCVGTVLISTLFFRLFGVENWYILSAILAAVPAVNIINFSFCPLKPVVVSEESMPKRKLFKSPAFILFFVMMICAGATELGMAQWASAYAEAALKVTKEIGDITGPCSFALAEGIGRMLHSKHGEKIRLHNMMLISGVVCLICYIGILIFSSPLIGLSCCILCGLFVGVLWPGTINTAAGYFPAAGTALFSMLALAGDVGCSAGPGLVGVFSSVFGDNLSLGMGIGCIFPIIFIICTLQYKKKVGEKNGE